MLTWKRLVRLEPRLHHVLLDAERAGDGDPDFCSLAAWYGYSPSRQPSFKGRVVELVGWFADPDAPEILKTSQAYEVAYFTVLSHLPPCRLEGCDCAGDKRCLRSYAQQAARAARRPPDPPLEVEPLLVTVLQHSQVLNPSTE